MKVRQVLTAAAILGLAVMFASCAGVNTQSAGSAFKDPVIKLESFGVPQYDEYWYFAKDVKPTKGAAGDRGAPLPLSFLFSITNPNSYPVKLEGITYTVAFDKEFDLITENNNDVNWIPGNTTDQVRITTMITARSALIALMLPNAAKIKAKGWDNWQVLERWWKDVPELGTPVTIKDGAFSFSAGKVSKVVGFEGTIP